MFRKIEKKQILKSLSRHMDITDEFYQQVTGISVDILENVGSDLAKRAISMAQEVDGDLHEHKAFLRFSISSHGILFAKIDKMKHKNEEAFLLFFKKRFPTFLILIESKRGVFYIDQEFRVKKSAFSLLKALSAFEAKLPKNKLLENLKDDEVNGLWKSFAQSQIIQGKKDSIQVKNLSKKWENVIPDNPSRRRSLEEYFSN